MADNTTINPGAGGDTIATDDISGVKHQRVKVEYGADGSATDVSAANPLPVYTPLADVVDQVRQSPAHDAFGRGRVAQPQTLFASSNEYDIGTGIWNSKLTAGGTATFLPNEAAVRMRVAASGDAVVRQSARHLRYLPGKSQLILVTGVLGAAVSNVTKRMGYFNANNGLFFQQTGSGMSVVRRTYTSGAAVDNAVAQADWNIDPMTNGTGPSGLTLDVTKPMIGVIDFEWLGVGRVRWGFNIDGMTHYVHESLWANRGSFAGVYMTTANLPVRYEITATGTPGSTPVDLMQICSTVVSEGGSDAEQQARLRAASNGTSTISVTTRRAIISIRPKATFNSIVNRAEIMPLSAEFINTGNQSVLIEIVRGGTLGGSPSWTSAGTDSVVEYDVAGTTVTGGDLIWAGYAANASQGGRLNLPLEGLSNADLPLTLDIDGANPIPLSLVVTSLGTGTACAGGFAWREVR